MLKPATDPRATTRRIYRGVLLAAGLSAAAYVGHTLADGEVAPAPLARPVPAATHSIKPYPTDEVPAPPRRPESCTGMPADPHDLVAAAAWIAEDGYDAAKCLEMQGVTAADLVQIAEALGYVAPTGGGR